MAIQETLAKFNWIDLLALLLLLRTCSVGLRSGLIIGLFKIVGWIVSLLVSLHYFSEAGRYLVRLIPPFGADFSNFACYIILSMLAYIAIAFFRQAILRLVKPEATSAVDRWGGLFLGFFVGIMLLSTVFIGFHLSGITYVKESLKRSGTGTAIAYANVKAYEGIVNGIVSKFSPDTTVNQDIYSAFESPALEE